MKKSLIVKILSLSVFALSLFTSCKDKSAKDSAGSKNPENSNQITVYAYDSFLGEWGPGNDLKAKFQEKTGLTLNFVDCGDAVQVLSRAILEKENVQADVIIGIDNYTADRAVEADILESYKPADIENIVDGTLINEISRDWKITPYDYSHFAIIQNTKLESQSPSCLNDLLDSKYQKKLIIMDPETSTPGLGFVAWTVAAFGDGYIDFWKNLKANILTMSPGWSEGWGLFEKSESPLVTSYCTSPAATLEYKGHTDYKALPFTDGHVMQVEGAAILKNAPNPQGARLFIDFLISQEAQSLLPLTQWMYPANKNVELPESYKKAALVPEKTISADPGKVQEAVVKIKEILQ